MKVELLFAWYDLWVGLYWDRKSRTLYALPIPMFGLKISFAPASPNACDTCGNDPCTHPFGHPPR